VHGAVDAPDEGQRAVELLAAGPLVDGAAEPSALVADPPPGVVASTSKASCTRSWLPNSMNVVVPLRSISATVNVASSRLPASASASVGRA
jgi:hypothetical protein